MFDDILPQERPFYKMVSEGWINVDLTDLKKGDVFYTIHEPHKHQLATSDPFTDGTGEWTITSQSVKIHEVKL